jgi:hypothetical protein
MHIQHPGGDVGQLLLFPPVVANGFFLEISGFETAAESLRNCNCDILWSSSSSSRRATNPSFGHFQSLDCPGCRLRLKARSR